MGLLDAARREFIYISSLARILRLIGHVKPDSTETISAIVARHAKKTPQAPAILFQDDIVTYAALDEAANRYANWALAQGIGKGDVVSLLMENRPEYLFAWLGLVRIGAIAALINGNLNGPPLAHSLKVAGGEHVIVGVELARAYGDIADALPARPKAWCTGGAAAGLQNLDTELAAASSAPPKIAQPVTCKDKAFYIFTSGTTGLPKAAVITHMRMLFMMYGFAGALNARASDRMYNVLPLYHSSGGICAVGVAFTAGGSLVLRRKLSVHEFWADCFRYKPTFFQYIGELCRYLLNAPPAPHERDHNLRAIVGNGLRPDIWVAFQTRFAIPRIIEFYGATEGNVAMLNYDGKVGAVGRLPDYLRWRFPIRILRFDIERGAPVRGPDGFCIECPPDEAGEAVGKIESEAGARFEGYTSAADTQKKILRDVFEKGDSWFRTGDLLKRDAQGYFYFVDRIGDTFRWKGENVATSEVAEALGVVPGIREANVYGVSVPGMDGRAGMAALVVDPAFDPAGLAQAIGRNLPAYAVPIFLRLTPEMEVTGTFKQRKVELVKEGFDPATIVTPLYWLNPATRTYEPLTRQVYADIISGRVKL